MNDKIQVNLRGEIVSATNFDGDTFYINYCYLLPEGWVCGDEAQLSGTTHCTARTSHVAHFNHLSDLALWVPLSTGGIAQLVMEVSSLDSWQRFRTEGYALANVPLTPGRRHLFVPTWRPLPDLANSHAARVADMRRFFIGGNPQLRDMGCHLAQSQTPPVMSRAGLRAESSGEIQLTFDCALQRSHSQVLPSVSQRNSHKHLVSSVDQVILAYTKVQARMSRVRQAMRLDLDATRD